MPSLLDIGRRIGPALGAVAPPLLSGLAGARASRNATNALTTGAKTAGGVITQAGADQQARLAAIYKAQQEALGPYQQAGLAGINRLTTGLAEGGGLADAYNPTGGPPQPGAFSWAPPDLANDPGFQFRLKEGLRAINASANASGTRFSGATLKSVNNYAQDAASQEAQAAFNRNLATYGINANEFQAGFERNRATTGDQYNRLSGLANIGQNATNTGVQAGANFGQQSGQNAQFTAAEIANLETEKASAEAAGDINKANTISSALAGAAKGLLDIGPAKTVQDYIKSLTNPSATAVGPQPGSPDFVGPVRGGLASVGSSTAVPGIATATPSTAIGAIPGITGAVGATAAPAAFTGGGLASIGAAGGGPLAGTGALAAPSVSAPSLSSTSLAHALLMSPWTIGIGAGIIAITALLKSQAHWEANTLVKTVQNPFGQKLGQIVDGFDRAFQSGQLDRASAQQARDATAAAIQDFETKLTAFEAKGGKDNKTVVANARRSMQEYFGPGYANILGKMDQEIASLPQAA